MLRKDYLLAQIEMLSGLVARLLKLREDGDEQAVTDEIDISYHDLFGLDPRLISLLPNQFLLDKIRSGEYLDSAQGMTLAILLREDAINHLERGNGMEHYQRMIRSLHVFLALSAEHQLQPEQIELYELETVLNQMTEYELPPDLKFELFHYYEDMGQFAQAEDMLHEIIDFSEDNGEIVNEGIAYYEWLLTLTDEELEAGNLPRAEVDEGLQHMKTQAA
jgi:hypothetical protein